MVCTPDDSARLTQEADLAQDPNEEVTGIDVRCLNCRDWSPSPIFISPFTTFETAGLAGNRFQCPHCGKMSDCNKENFRVRFAGGGFRGSETFG